MKVYLSPETKSLQVEAQNMICTSAEAPMRKATLQNAVKTSFAWT